MLARGRCASLAFTNGGLTMGSHSNPTSNTGAKVLLGASGTRQKNAQVSVLIDYLSLTLKVSKPCLQTVQQPLLEAFQKVDIKLVNETFVVMEASGYQGWKYSAFAIRHGKVLALLAWGGEVQRGRIFISLTGTGCELLNQQAIQLLHDKCVNHAGKITRIDLSVDDIDGKHTLGSVRRRYALGQFNAGGRPPEKREFSNNKGKGNSIYIGGKSSSKQLRAYEKGKQLGKPDSPWLRIEVQLRQQSNRTIPLDVLLNPAPYFAGAYPALELMFKNLNTTPARIKTVTATVALNVEKLLKNISRSAGRAIGFLISAGASEQRLVDYVRRDPGRYAKQFNQNIVHETLVALHLTIPQDEPP